MVYKSDKAVCASAQLESLVTIDGTEADIQVELLYFDVFIGHSLNCYTCLIIIRSLENGVTVLSWMFPLDGVSC